MTQPITSLPTANDTLNPNSAMGLGELLAEHLRKYFKAHNGHLPAPGLYKRFVEEIERPLLVTTLRAVGGSQVKAAAILGITRNTLRKKIKILNAKNLPKP